MQQRTLPVDLSPKSLFLTSGAGAVWPIRTADEMHSLMQLTKLFSARMEEVSGHPGQTKAVTEEVVGLGNDVEEAARLYAHLTNRSFRAAGDFDDLNKGVFPTVIITKTSWLGSELMERLYTLKSNQPAPGLICARTPEKLHRQVLIRAATAALTGSPEVFRIDFHPLLPLSRIVAQGHELLGGRASAGDIQTALRRGAGILTVQTHSDGIDAFLSSHFTLCPMDRSPVEAIDLLSPRCKVTGICYRRLDTSIEDGLRSGALLSPNAICARVFIWDTCFGLLPPDGVVDPAWGLGARFLESPTIGAVITSWTISMTEPGHTEELSRDLISGMTCGEALGRFNRSEKSCKYGRHAMCLLGDPRVRLQLRTLDAVYGHNEAAARLAVQVSPRPSPYSILNPQQVRTYPPADKLEVALLRESLAHLISESPNPSRLVTNALNSIRAYETAAQLELPLEEGETAPGPTMRRALMQFAFKRGKLFDVWTPFAREYRLLDLPFPCFACGRLTNTTIANFSFPGVSPRRFSICPRCGIVNDTPQESSFSFSLINGSSVLLNGRLPGERWLAGILLGCPGIAENVGWEWPAAVDGTPIRTFRIPDRWPPGPVRISVIMLWEQNFAILSQPAREQKISSPVVREKLD